MSKKKKGDLLEWVVHILEQSLATNKSKIVRHYPLVDEHGVKRELDIYAETEVNGKNLKYAFECKHYKSGIKISHITDFHSMISNKGLKGFFVTTSNYQSGAKEKAAGLGIELLQLKKRDANPNDLEGVIFVGKEFRITGIKIDGNLEGKELKTPADFIESCPACSKTIVDIVVEDILPIIQSRIDEGVEAIHPEYANIKELVNTSGEQNARELDIIAVYDDSTITHKGIVMNIKFITVKIKVWNRVIEKRPLVRHLYSYLGNTSSDILANFSANEFLFQDQNLIVGVTTLNDGKRKMSITSNVSDTTNITEMVCFGTIDELGIRNVLNRSNNRHE